MQKRIPEDEFIDQVTVTQASRYKESGLSGSCWRYFWLVQLWRKGVVVLHRVVPGTRAQALAVAAYGSALGYGELQFDEDWNPCPRADIPDDLHCAQPGCRSLGTTRYALGGPPKPGERQPYRLFCEKHCHRGDSTIGDCNSSQTLIV